MKGFESVIQGYAEGGSVSSNPFEAYSRDSLANPFAGLMNLPARPQYTPRATTPTTTSPLRGYMDIYGNLAAIREEQARRRAAAAPAPQDDQPSQGSEPTPGPTTPTPQPETLPPREIETGTPLEPDLPSPFETPPPDLSIEYPAEAMPMPDTGLPQQVAPGPVELGLPGFDESQPVIPPGLGFDSIPAPDLTLSVTREDLPPPEITEVVQAPETVDVNAVLGGTASDVLSGAAKDDSAKAPEKSTLADLAKTVFSGIGTTNPLGLANMLGGMAATQALKGEEEAPMSLTQLALEKFAPSMVSTGISPAAKQEMVDRGNTAGAAMAEAVGRGDISKDAAATALTNDINLVGSLGHALSALESGTKNMQGTEDTGLALSPGDTSEVESAESDTGTAPSTDVGPPSGFDAGFGSGFDFGGYDGGFQGGDAGGSESEGGGSGSESEGGGGWAEGGYIPGDSGGMDDDVPALIDGKEPAKLSSGEFVFDAATVAAMGDGNNEAGAKKLNMLREAIRKKAYGHKKQPPKNFSVGDLVRFYDRMR